MNKKANRLVSILLAALLLAGMLPGQAWTALAEQPQGADVWWKFVPRSATQPATLYISGAETSGYELFSEETQIGGGSVPWRSGLSRNATLVVIEENPAPASTGSWFADMHLLEEIQNLPGLDTSRVKDMSLMFSGCASLSELNLSSFNTSNVENMAKMFSDCKALSELNLSSFNTSRVKNMSRMFYNCEALGALDLSSFNTAMVEDMSYLFCGCKALTALDLTHFNTGKAKDFQYMFGVCQALTTLDLRTFDTSSAANMYRMFYECRALTELDLSTFDTSKATNLGDMFFRCGSLRTIYAAEHTNWYRDGVTMDGMFQGCAKLEGGSGSTHTALTTGGQYARIDGGPGSKGYFTSNYRNVWVGNVKVTTLNEDNILDEIDAVTNLPTAAFDHKTGTLTLHNPDIYGAYQSSRIYSERSLILEGEAAIRAFVGVKIYAPQQAQPITLTLRNVDITINAIDETAYATGIRAENAHVVMESGTLSIVSDGNGVSAFGQGSFTMNGGKAAINGGEYGVDSANEIIYNGGILTASGAQRKAFSKDIDLSGCDPAPGTRVSVNPSPANLTAWNGTTPLGGSQSSFRQVELIERYNLWLGSRQVTVLNKDDIFEASNPQTGKPTASYEPETKTLTLRNPSINGYYEGFKIWTSDSLTLQGRVILNATGKGIGGIFVENRPASVTSQSDLKTLTIENEPEIGTDIRVAAQDGDGIRVWNTNVVMNGGRVSAGTGNSPAIDIAYHGSLTVNDGELVAKSTGSRGLSVWMRDNQSFGSQPIPDGCNITINGGRVEAQSRDGIEPVAAITRDAGTISYSQSHVAYDGDGNELFLAAGGRVIVDADGRRYTGARITIEPRRYNLWVGGVQVTEANKNNVLGLLNIEGKPTVVFTPKEGENPATLTLSDAVINGTQDGPAIRTEWTDMLELALEGSSVINASPRTGTGEDSHGIRAYSLDVTGDGSLTVNGAEAGNNSYGIEVMRTLRLRSGALIVRGAKAGKYSYGIDVENTLEVSGGTLDSRGGEADAYSFGIEAAFFEVGGGEITALGGKAGASSIGANVAGGTGQGILTMRGGTLAATGGEAVAYSNGLWTEAIDLQGGSLVARGATRALANTFNLVGGDYSILDIMVGTETAASAPLQSWDGSTPLSDKSSPYKSVQMVPIKTYPVWVAGTRVSERNRDNVLGAKNEEGVPTVVYTPAQDSAPAKLTLTDANIGFGAWREDNGTPISGAWVGIQSLDDIEIELNGDNFILIMPTLNEIFASVSGIMVSTDLRFSGPGNLTVRATGKAELCNGIGAGGRLAMEGAGHVQALPADASARSIGISAERFDLYSGRVTARAGAADYSVGISAALCVEDGILYAEGEYFGINSSAEIRGGTVETVSAGKALGGEPDLSNLPLSHGVMVGANAGPEGAQGWNGRDKLNGSFKYVKICPVVSYQLQVGGVEVNELNKDNVIGDNNNDGTPDVVYTPAEGDAPARLTLNDAEISVRYENGDPAGIRSGADTALELMLNGRSSISNVGWFENGYGIYAANSLLTILGEGSLECSAESSDAQDSVAIYTEGSLTVLGGTIEARSGKSGWRAHGICVGGTFTVKGGDITAWTFGGGYMSQGVSAKSLIVEGGFLRAHGLESGILIQDGGGSIYGSFEIRGGTVEAKAFWSDGKAMPQLPQLYGYEPTPLVMVNSESTEGGAWEWDGSSSLTDYRYVKIGPASRRSYRLWVQGVQVTEANRDNVLGDETASVVFTPGTGVSLPRLTLTNVDIEGMPQYNNDFATNGIYCEFNLELVLIGDNTITGTAGNGVTYSSGIFVDGDLDICGPGSLTVAAAAGSSTSYGIQATRQLFVWGGNVSAAAAQTYNSCGIDAETVIVEGGVLSAYGGVRGISSDQLLIYGGTVSSGGFASGGRALSAIPYLAYYIPASPIIMVSSNASGDGAVELTSNEPLTDYAYVKISPRSIEKYNLWVQGTQVTSENRDDVLGDGGSVRFSPGEGASTSTLSLHNATIEGRPHHETQNMTSGIYSEISLDLNYYGYNTITGTTGDGVSYSSGIYVDGILDLSGSSDDRLEVTAAAGSAYSYAIAAKDGYVSVSGEVHTAAAPAGEDSCGIIASSVEIGNGTLTAEGAKYGICGNVTVNYAGGVEARSGNKATSGTVRWGNFEPETFTVKVSANADGSNAQTITGGYSVNGGGYRYVKVFPTPEYNVWVQGTRVTESNRDNVLGDGKVRYTPAEGGSPAKLTLTDAYITDADHPKLSDGSAVSLYSEENLVLELVGDSTVLNPNAADMGAKYGAGIFAAGNLTVVGEGSLNAEVVDGNCAMNVFGIYVAGTLSVESGTVCGKTDVLGTDYDDCAGVKAGLVLVEAGALYANSAQFGFGLAVREAGSIVVRSGRLEALGKEAAVNVAPQLREYQPAEPLVLVNAAASSENPSEWNGRDSLTGFGCVMISPPVPTGYAISGRSLAWDGEDNAEYAIFLGSTEDKDIREAWQKDRYDKLEGFAGITTWSTDAVSSETVNGRRMFAQSFSFTDVAPGEYKLAIFKEGGYVPKIVAFTVEDSDVPLGELKLWLYGDVNYDGSVDGTDAAQIQRYYANKAPNAWTIAQEEDKADMLLAADVNRSETIDGADASQVQRYYANKTPNAFSGLR